MLSCSQSQNLIILPKYSLIGEISVILSAFRRIRPNRLN